MSPCCKAATWQAPLSPSCSILQATSQCSTDDIALRDQTRSSQHYSGVYGGSFVSVQQIQTQYNALGTVTMSATTYASVLGVSGSGGSETQNFCYDEQNSLLWASNSGIQPGAGSGTSPLSLGTLSWPGICLARPMGPH